MTASKSARGAAPLDVGIAPQRPEAGARRVDQHAIEDVGKGQRLRCVGLDDARARWRRRRRRCRRAAGPAWRGRRRPRPCPHCPWPPPSRASCRPARRTHRGSRSPGLRRRDLADELRGLVLHDEQPLRRERSEQGIAARHDQAVGSEARGLRLDARLRSACRELVARDAQAVGAQRQRRRLVVEPAPGFSRLEPVPRPPSLHQPARMRQRRSR